ncbi:MAG TPA: F0F1 ATP synthase subunit gamma [Candidatus Saccharimonadales bacterium]
MKRAILIQKDLNETHTLEGLTEVFESIASLHIAKIRGRVVASKAFFDELWQTYQAIRIDPKDRLKRTGDHEMKMRDVFLAITGEGKLSGYIDEQIIDTLLDAHKTTTDTEIMVIGAHGLSQLRHKGVAVAGSFPMPVSDEAFSVSDIIEQLSAYRRITVFYQTYESLRVQKIARIELVSAVRDMSEGLEEETETLNPRDYIFEPDLHKIADYMESVMMGVALIQLIMESKLAQYATRFTNMSRAKHRAGELASSYQRQFLRSKRAENDDRLKEVIGAVRRLERSV